MANLDSSITDSASVALLKMEMAKARLVVMHEVYDTDDKSRKIASVGFVSDKTLADAMVAQNPADIAGGLVTSEQVVLTDGETHFIVDFRSLVFILNDEEEKEKIRSTVLEKIKPEERELLGL